MQSASHRWHSLALVTVAVALVAVFAYAGKVKPIAAIKIKDNAHGVTIKEQSAEHFLLVLADGRAWSSLTTEHEIFETFAPLFADEWTVADLVLTNTLWDLVTGFTNASVTAALVGVTNVGERTEFTYRASETCRIVLDLPAGALPPSNAAIRIEVSP